MGMNITLIGHPWSPIGMGEQLRSHIAALASVHVEPLVYDIFRFATRSDHAHARLLAGREVDAVGGGVRIFHLNGDEVDNARAAFAERGLDWHGGRNIIVPAWELPRYPTEWASRLRLFDEVWALSGFIQQALAAAGVESHLIGQSVEPVDGPLLPRRHFGIRESAYAFLLAFDLTSYSRRKNPEAVLEFFKRLVAVDPLADLQLVLKVKQGEFGAPEWARAFQAEYQLPGKLVLIDRPLDSLGMRSLMAACDCFVSLHRAEGFGRGLGEAMALGRLAVGTNWSGSVDFLTAETGVAVAYRLVELDAGDYPHGDGQVWAEADVDDAVAQVTALLAEPKRARELARAGQAAVLRGWSHRALGLRMLERVEGRSVGSEWTARSM
jgi:glycosyltransferase involved in cell wall biosynthesis